MTHCRGWRGAVGAAAPTLALGLALLAGSASNAAGQQVIPGGTGPITAPDAAAEHWSMDAVRRAEALGLLRDPLPFRRALSLDVVAALLEQAAVAARGRGEGLERMAEGWRQRFYREFGGASLGVQAGEVRLLGVRASARAEVGDGLEAPGFREVGAGRTGAVPLPDEARLGVGGEVVAALGTAAGALIEPEVRTDGVLIRRVDLVAGWGNWKFSVGRQPLGLAKSPHAGLVLSGSVPIDRLEVRTESPAVLPGVLRFVGPVSAEAFLGRLWDEDRHAREPYFWGGTLSIQPLPRVGLAVHRAAMFGGRGYDAPFTAKTVVDMLIGRVANLGFENQVVSVEGRFRLPTERWVPLTAWVEWGAEDAAGGWWDVPGRVVGLETPAVPGAEALSLGAAYTHIEPQCCGNSPWYRHTSFDGSWALWNRPLGHPLGGEGTEWRAYGGYDRPERNFRVEGQIFRRARRGQNLYVPGREESTGGALDLRWTERHGVELEAGVGVESGSGFTELRMELGTHLYF